MYNYNTVYNHDCKWRDKSTVYPWFYGEKQKRYITMTANEEIKALYTHGFMGRNRNGI